MLDVPVGVEADMIRRVVLESSGLALAEFRLFDLW
jgi:hypothetical protein